MNQQASDLPWPVQMIGRYRSLIGLVALLGALAGIVFAALEPAGVHQPDAGRVYGADVPGRGHLRRAHVLARLPPGQVARGTFRAESR